jgi:hypothetical protein
VLLMNDARWPWLILVPGIGASRGDALYQSSLTQTQKGRFPNRLKFDSTKRT